MAQPTARFVEKIYSSSENGKYSEYDLNKVISARFPSDENFKTAISRGEEYTYTLYNNIPNDVRIEKNILLVGFESFGTLSVQVSDKNQNSAIATTEIEISFENRVNKMKETQGFQLALQSAQSNWSSIINGNK